MKKCGNTTFYNGEVWVIWDMGAKICFFLSLSSLFFFFWLSFNLIFNLFLILPAQFNESVSRFRVIRVSNLRLRNCNNFSIRTCLCWSKMNTKRENILPIYWLLLVDLFLICHWEMTLNDLIILNFVNYFLINWICFSLSFSLLPPPFTFLTGIWFQLAIFRLFEKKIFLILYLYPFFANNLYHTRSSTMGSNKYASMLPMKSCNNFSTITCLWWSKRRIKRRELYGHLLILEWIYKRVLN